MPIRMIADITSVGSAAFDVFVSAPHTTAVREGGERVLQFPLGAKIKVESVTETCGGGAANTSVGFARLGMQARFCGVIGDDEWGQRIQQTLKKEGVLTDAAVIVEKEVSGFSIILLDPASGDRTVLYAPNTNTHLSEPVLATEMLKQSRWLFLNHLSDASCSILQDCLTLIRKPGGLSFAWNPGGSQIREGWEIPLMREMLRHTDVLFLNAEEAALFTKKASVADAFHVLTHAGVRIACITDGANGASLSDGKTVWECPVDPSTRVIDATGAGDAFGVGVTWALFSGLPLPNALKAGMLGAASVVSQVGTQAGLLSEREMRKTLQTTSLSVTSSSLR